MAEKVTNISIRLHVDEKEQADALFAELGMGLSTAVHIFIRQALREGRIPFEITMNQPSREKIATMLEIVKDCERPADKLNE